MIKLPVLGLCVLLLAQSDPTRQVQELIDGIRPDKIDERDQAAKKLKELGKSALPELEKAAESGDRDLSARARLLLKVIPIRSRLSANLIAQVPGIDDRLASGDAHTWTTAFLEFANQVTVEADLP